MDRRKFIAAVAATGTGMALAAPGGTAWAQAARDTVVVAQSGDALTMDPARHSHYPTASVAFQIYDPLISLGADGTFKPALAASWSTPDPLTWEFKLRPGVKFHDGSPLTSADVKFTFERALDPEFKAPYFSRISAIKAVETPDPLTVRFKTATPFPTMLYSLYEASFPALIVPAAYVKANGNDALATKPVGTGPYRLVEWRKDDRIVLEANPDYWGGAPKIKTVVFRPIREVRTRIAELRSGGVDIIGDVPPEDIAGLERGGARVSAVASDILYFFHFDTLKDTPLRDKRVRQAINYAIDVDAIHKAIMGGLGNRIDLVLPKGAFGYDETVGAYPFDPAKARQLLTEAGYPNGFTIPLLSRQGRYLKDKEVMEASIGYLARVGIKVEPRYLEPGVWAQVSERKGREGLIFGGWSGLDPDLVWYPLLYTGQYQSYYSNKELDALLDKGRSTVDPAARKAIYREAALLMKEDAPNVPMLQPPLIYAINTRLDWAPRIDSIIDMRGAAYK